ncbi:hypothetical protein IC575_021472 [Cucumis melo]
MVAATAAYNQSPKNLTQRLNRLSLLPFASSFRHFPLLRRRLELFRQPHAPALPYPHLTQFHLFRKPGATKQEQEPSRFHRRRLQYHRSLFRESICRRR